MPGHIPAVTIPRSKRRRLGDVSCCGGGFEEKRKDVLEAPGGFHRGKTATYQTDTDDNATHPDVGAETGHDEIRRQVEDYIANVKEGQTCRDLVRCEVEDVGEVVPRVRVHGLGQAYIGPDGRAEEIEDPKSGDDAAVQLSVDMSGLIFG